MDGAGDFPSAPYSCEGFLQTTTGSSSEGLVPSMASSLHKAGRAMPKVLGEQHNQVLGVVGDDVEDGVQPGRALTKGAGQTHTRSKQMSHDEPLSREQSLQSRAANPR